MEPEMQQNKSGRQTLKTDHGAIKKGLEPMLRFKKNFRKKIRKNRHF
jgi:hypothetical protein